MAGFLKPERAPALRASEKGLLHLLRMRGAMSKADLARLSNMSAQGVSIIIERLLDLDLVTKGEKKRGRVGQPSTPIALNPEGAISVGIFVGSGKAQLVVADFQGEIRAQHRVHYTDAHSPEAARDILAAAVALPDSVAVPLWKRRVGVGLTADETLMKRFGHAPSDAVSTGERVSLAQRLEERMGVPVHGVDDIRAACIAEMMMASDDGHQNTLYLDIGASFGAGLILEGRLLGAEMRPSCRLDRLAMPGLARARVGDVLSLRKLIAQAAKEGVDFADQVEIGFVDLQDAFDAWRGDAMTGLSAVIAAAAATVPLDRVLIAGELGPATLSALVDVEHEVAAQRHHLAIDPATYLFAQIRLAVRMATAARGRRLWPAPPLEGCFGLRRDGEGDQDRQKGNRSHTPSVAQTARPGEILHLTCRARPATPRA